MFRSFIVALLLCPTTRASESMPAPHAAPSGVSSHGGPAVGACCANEALICTPDPPGTPRCGGSFSCGCFETTEREGVCVHLFQFCDAIGPCESSADCPDGTACIVNTGCGDPTCLPIDCAVPEPLAENAGDAQQLVQLAPLDLPAARGISAECQEVSAQDCAAAGGTYHGDGTTCESNPCCTSPAPAFDPQPPDGASAQPTELTFNGGCPTSITVQGDLTPDAYFDTWMFTAAPGTPVIVLVDTVSAATAFDPAFCLAEHFSSSACFTFADDTFTCTFPPPAFSCPRAADNLDPDADWQYFLTVYSASSGGNFAGPVGEYALTIFADGPICGLTLVADNRTPETTGLPRELRRSEKMKPAPPRSDPSDLAPVGPPATLFRDGASLTPDATAPMLTAGVTPLSVRPRGNVLPGAINFDDVTAPCAFNQTTRLTNQYADQGVIFVGQTGNNGGAILNQCGGLGVSGHSPPNFLAFSNAHFLADGGIPWGPETILFSPPVSSVHALFGSQTAAGTALTMTAYRSDGLFVESDSLILAPQMAMLGVTGPEIARIVISSFAGVYVMDNLQWFQCRELYTVFFDTVNPPVNTICVQSPLPWCNLPPLVDGTTYYWQVRSQNCCDTLYGPVWSFTAGEPGCPCADFTGDNLVNLVDFVTFQVCFGAVGPNVDCPPDVFACADLNADGIINLVDFVTFQTIFFLTPDGITPPDCLSID